MTVPGGVPNLPPGALTFDTLESLQDQTAATIRARATGRIPSTFYSGTLGDPTTEFSFGGLVTKLFAGFSSAVANADPADIEGPADLPPLTTGFIDELPIIGTLAGLADAVYGTYEGDDPVLLFMERLFAPVRALMDGTSDLPTDFPNPES